MNEISSEPHTKGPICGEFSRSRLKFSSENEVFERVQFSLEKHENSSVQAKIVFFFLIWALREGNKFAP